MIKTISPPAPPSSWADHAEIPGSRCGPDDGPWPRPFQLLSESEVTAELNYLAKPLSFSIGTHFKAYGINFQPCHGYRTQDRYAVHELDVHGKKWTFTGVFDGHLGDTTVEHTAYHLPIIVKEFLCAAEPSTLLNPNNVSHILSNSMTSFDKAIAGDVLEIFPGGLQSLSSLSDYDIQTIIYDNLDAQLYKKARLCMYGTTALVALVDPEHQNLWVANLGDCQAVFVSPDPSGKWATDPLTVNHNGDNDAEIARLLREHPGEPECIIDRRVLGALAPTRGIGDVPFKQPPEFTRRILYNIFPGYRSATSAWEEFLVRNLSAPYISSEPEVVHRRLSSPKRNGYLIMCSDGLADLYTSRHLSEEQMIEDWANVITRDASNGEDTENLAVKLLRHAIGGDDVKSVSRVMTLDMDSPWIDDTTILVQAL